VFAERCRVWVDSARRLMAAGWSRLRPAVDAVSRRAEPVLRRAEPALRQAWSEGRATVMAWIRALRDRVRQLWASRRAWPLALRRFRLSRLWPAVPVVLLLAAFVAVLTFEAYIDAVFKPDGKAVVSEDRASVPVEILEGGPYIDTTDGHVVSYELPPHTVVLTFDDGPSPEWTPRILEVLARHGVKGTFFVLGTEVARYPDIVRAMVEQGHDVGVHSFTHPNLSAVSPTLRSLEYSQTQMALAAAAGVTTPLIRFPYSSGSSSLDDANWSLVLEAGRAGYVVVMSSVDSRDWETPGVDRIVEASTPADGQPGVILLHDAGGDRSQTVEALDRLIPLLKERGYQFLTASEGLRAAQALAGVDPALVGTSVDPSAIVAEAVQVPVLDQATPAEVWRGRLLALSVRVADGLLDGLRLTILIVGALLVVRTVALFLLAGRHARQRRSPKWSWGPPVTRPVSVVMPAYNEQENIAAAVRSIACGDYPAIEVVVVDDGSTDDTAAIVAGLGLPNVRLISIPNGGKANALNVGIAHASHDIIVMVDGDTVFEPDSLRMLVQPFADPRVGGVAGNVKVSNRRGLIGKWQHIEYVIGFNLDRRLYELMQCMPTIPGAIGAFRRQALRDVGGVSDRTLAEDTDLTMAIIRAGWKVVYEERARAWTEAPHTLRQLWRQRYRWSYGTMQAMWIHRGAIRDAGASGRFGRIGLPFLVAFGIAFPLLAPVVDIMTIYGIAVTGNFSAALAWLAMLGLQLVTAAIAFRLDGESLRPLWSLPLQQFVYRQLLYTILVRSVVAALAGVALRWHKLQRIGAAAARVATASVSTASVSTASVSTAPVSTVPVSATALIAGSDALALIPRQRDTSPVVTARTG
jgi:cellulose synthase/poly-beta-1,6-N-acetylglucosamine synthase-like glycosyltransferase/peptidoglycan/xylan/chitin deacetylase (PgdA/CDA1 family)